MTEPMRGSSVVLRQFVGRFLRRLRDDADLTRPQAAAHLERGVATVQRIEDGNDAVRLTVRDVRSLAEFCKATPAQVEALTEIVRMINQDTKTDAWWSQHNGVLPIFLEMLIALEDVCSTIRVFDPATIPGLFQSRSYAEALNRTGQDGSPLPEADRYVDVRVQRQSILRRADLPEVTAVIGQAALMQEVGGRRNMQEQLLHLVGLVDAGVARIHVMPFTAGTHPGLLTGSTAFQLMTFPVMERLNIPVHPPMAEVDTLTRCLFFTDRSELDAYNEVWASLHRASLDDKASRALIARTAEEYG